MISELKKPMRGLGRGLDALLPGGDASRDLKVKGGYFQAQIEEVYPAPDQPRRRFVDAELDELAQSIKAHGIIMPLVVRPRPGGGHVLIAGERRWRAAQRAGLHQVPVVVQDVDDREAFERALVENLQRSDLNPIEEASAYQRLVEELGLSQEAVAERCGKDRSTVANAMRLLKLPAAVRQSVEEKKLSMGHARALLGLASADDIEVGARQVLAKEMSVRETEEMVRKRTKPRTARASTPGSHPGASQKSASVRDLEERLTSALGGPTVLTEDAAGKGGTITIRYQDLDHLDQLLNRLL